MHTHHIFINILITLSICRKFTTTTAQYHPTTQAYINNGEKELHYHRISHTFNAAHIYDSHTQRCAGHELLPGCTCLHMNINVYMYIHTYMCTISASFITTISDIYSVDSPLSKQYMSALIQILLNTNITCSNAATHTYMYVCIFEGINARFILQMRNSNGNSVLTINLLHYFDNS